MKNSNKKKIKKHRVSKQDREAWNGIAERIYDDWASDMIKVRQIVKK